MNALPFQTVRDMLRYAVTRFNAGGLFFGHGCDNAFDEAVFLILHTLSLPIDRLEPFLDARLRSSEIAVLVDLIERRVAERIPVAYLTRETWLQGYRFYVDGRVIVPRSFIAELIGEQFAPWLADPDSVHRILELCTGSACLAVLLADAFPHARIDAADISHDALEVARINVERYGMEDRISLICSDLYQNLGTERYDLIIANPPYVNDDSMRKLPPEYQHEPYMALAGGHDGMDITRRIVADAKPHLTENGLLVVEIGNEARHAKAAFAQRDLTWLSTSGGDDRVFLLAGAAL
ncbi:MAG: 50S ribosomal protein L3 N(5)-glutamine methyltransferase [Burkholderiaceae bacterium]|jgi:ribosomal protein L3 glutamine methyltransferase|nr:50S ribosomal protein L3 N(5)-glutamine methyltransferase [Burkholderiaceae bacterium]